jgi:hypothetical protein
MFFDDDGQPYEIAQPLACGHVEAHDARRIHLTALFRGCGFEATEFKVQPTACEACAIAWFLVNAIPSKGFTILASSGVSPDWLYASATDWLKFDSFSRVLDGPRTN